MPCESHSYDAALYFYDGVHWKLLSHVRCDEDCPSIWKDEEPKVEEEQKVPDERFERDLSNLKKKLKNKFYKQGYLTVGDMVDILSLNVSKKSFNPYILYTGDTARFKEDMTKLAMDFYRKYKKSTWTDEEIKHYGIRSWKTSGLDYHTEFELINEALDDLENTKQK